MKSQALVYFPFDHLSSAQRELGLEIFPKLKTMHEERIKGFLTARLALLEAFRLVGLKLELKDLELMEFNYLPKYKEFSFSLSHSNYQLQSVAGAFLSLGEKRVGFDLEWSKRKLKEGSERYFVRDEDQYDNLLQLWCFKEAAFKSISSQFTPGLLLKDLWVKHNQFGHFQNDKIVLGELNLEKVQFLENELLLATAQSI
jgi:phosphopantetheinyl transferase (holo-ACP synthase)